MRGAQCVAWWARCHFQPLCTRDRGTGKEGLEKDGHMRHGHVEEGTRAAA